MVRIKSFKWDKICSSGMPHTARANLLQVDILAKRNQWTILFYEPEKYILSLQRDGVKMNVYLLNFAILTQMQHPRWSGLTNLKRKGLTKKEIEQIFINPRQHTNKGAYKK